jgi:hypothetical protein
MKDLRSSIPSVERELATIVQSLPNPVGLERFATANEIFEDLLAVNDEFEELAYDLRLRRLTVTTEPIVLEGVYLGPFEIQLQWARLACSDAPAYRVFAKDPHPAESRDSITHPHVMDEVLCEGDGRHAIRQALVQGRLLDFFTLIAGILRTYNPESPFVELALWSGSTCSDCGAVVDEDESYSCQKCGQTVCGGCEAACCGCEDSCCSECITSCASCEDNYCRRCVKPCDNCQERVCAGCLDKHERCPKCHEEECSEDEGTNDGNSAPDGAKVQSHGLGQALVPA